MAWFLGLIVALVVGLVAFWISTGPDDMEGY